ncbi:MAG: hypothetical protein II828_05765 [Clostridia bacterium]|nr:hypothetical protein [Clostridia bacterium]
MSTSSRKKYRFITRVDPTPAELKEATLRGMIARRQERKRKAYACGRKIIRAAAAAAALMLAAVATPLRSYVAHAAGTVYQAIAHHWREDVFSVNLKKSDNGCTVEIVESRLANDFLYFTVKEYYPNDLVTRDSDTGQYSFPDIVYSGRIRDNEGNALPFDSRQIMCLWAVGSDHAFYRKGYENRVFTQSAENEDERNSEYVVNAQYRVYLPHMSAVVNSAEKTFTCSVEAISHQMHSHLAFDFPLDNVSETVGSKRCELNRTFPLDGANVTFQTLAFSPSGADLIVRIDPDRRLSSEQAAALIDSFDASVYVRNDADAKKLSQQSGDAKEKQPDPIGYAWLTSDLLNGHGYVYDLSEDVNADAMMWNQPRGMKMGDSYYLVLSDFADQPNSHYDMEKITRSDFTVEIEYLRWCSDSENLSAADMPTHYIGLDNYFLNAQKVDAGHYAFTGQPIHLPGAYGDLDIMLMEITETQTRTVSNGKYSHILDVEASMAYSCWDSMVKDATWENIYLVNAAGEEVMTIGLQIETLGAVRDGVTRPFAVKCEVTDKNKHFALSENNLTLYVSKVVETQSYEPNVWINARFNSEDVDLLNEQRYFHIQVKA